MYVLMGVSEQMFYRWKKKFAGLGVAEVHRLRQLEEENRRPKQPVADPSLEDGRVVPKTHPSTGIGTGADAIERRTIRTCPTASWINPLHSVVIDLPQCPQRDSGENRPGRVKLFHFSAAAILTGLSVHQSGHTHHSYPMEPAPMAIVRDLVLW